MGERLDSTMLGLTLHKCVVVFAVDQDHASQISFFCRLQGPCRQREDHQTPACLRWCWQTYSLPDIIRGMPSHWVKLPYQELAPTVTEVAGSFLPPSPPGALHPMLLLLLTSSLSREFGGTSITLHSSFLVWLRISNIPRWPHTGIYLELQIYIKA